jgi:hypothetical protein
MRYFFHIVDRYGLFPDGIGFECADRHAAFEHAERIAAELAKAGEFFRAGAVLVTGNAVPAPISGCDRSTLAGPAVAAVCDARFLPRLATEKPGWASGKAPSH